MHKELFIFFENFLKSDILILLDVSEIKLKELKEISNMWNFFYMYSKILSSNLFVKHFLYI